MRDKTPIQEVWDNMTPEAQTIEMQKCEDSVVYFYNTYVRRDSQPEITEEQWDAHLSMVDRYSNGRSRRHTYAKPVVPDDAYPGLPGKVFHITLKKDWHGKN